MTNNLRLKEFDELKIRVCNKMRINQNEVQSMMTSAKIKIVIKMLFMGVALSSCHNSEQGYIESKKEIENLINKINELENRIQIIESTQRIERHMNNTGYEVYLLPGTKGYRIIRSEMGSFAISLESIESGTSGSIIKLYLGNLVNAKMRISLQLNWGEMGEDGPPKIEESKTQEFKISNTLIPGAWTPVEFTLNEADPLNIRFIKVSNLRHTEIALSEQY